MTRTRSMHGVAAPLSRLRSGLSRLRAPIPRSFTCSARVGSSAELNNEPSPNPPATPTEGKHFYVTTPIFYVNAGSFPSSSPIKQQADLFSSPYRSSPLDRVGRRDHSLPGAPSSNTSSPRSLYWNRRAWPQDPTCCRGAKDLPTTALRRREQEVSRTRFQFWETGTDGSTGFGRQGRGEV